MSSIKWDAPELAERYDRVSDSQFERAVLLVKKMGIGPGDAVLDIGCGTGRLAMYLSSVVGPRGRVIGIDPSPHRIGVAQRQAERSGHRERAICRRERREPGQYAGRDVRSRLLLFRFSLDRRQAGSP